MNARRDPDQLIHAFLMEGQTELADPVYDVVRATIERKRQRVVIGPWRTPDAMNKFVTLGLGAAAVVVALIIGTQVLGPPAPSGVGVPPSATTTAAPTATPTATPTAFPSTPPSSGTVQYQLDGAPATTEVDVVADGTSVSGTAVTTFVRGTHSVRLECAARDGDTWALGGTIEQSTAEAGSTGAWSAVIVRDGSPQRIGVWLSDDKSEGVDCAGWLGAIDMASVEPESFQPVESGVLVPPPDLAP